MFGKLVVCYLFLGGTGAGACFVASILSLLVPANEIASRSAHFDGSASYDRDDAQSLRHAEPDLLGRMFMPVGACHVFSGLFLPVFVAALVVMMLGMVCLAVDLGRVDRLVLLLVQPALSYIAVGAWSLATCVLLAFVLLLFWGGVWRCCPLAAFRSLNVLLAASSLIAAAYTGLLLFSMPSVPLWSTSWLPVLFVLSSLSCGIALVLTSATLSGSIQVFGRVCRVVMKADVLLIMLELLAFAAFVAACTGMMTKSGNATEVMAAASASHLLSGDLAPLFWGGFAVVGILLPAAVEIAALRLHKSPSQVVLVVAALVFVGGFVMRYCLTQAGAHPLLI